jgi:hypothetical protein
MNAETRALLLSLVALLAGAAAVVVAALFAVNVL